MIGNAIVIGQAVCCPIRRYWGIKLEMRVEKILHPFFALANGLIGIVVVKVSC
jgi:hypothetical protein